MKVKVIAIETTDEQKANLKTLADYVSRLPDDYEHFDMRYWYVEDAEGGEGVSYIPLGVESMLNNCGTVSCFAGHGPAAGIPYTGEMLWSRYVYSNFTGGSSGLWDWLFGSMWASVDNTPQGAAKRAYWFLKHGGIPHNYYSQMMGYAPLCYV